MKNKKTLKKVILGSFFLLGSVSLFAQTQKVHTLQAKNTSTSTTMNSDALIQMDSDNKGLLLPRIALTGANQVAPLTAHTAGMVVYNTATVAATATIEAVTPGYYYNDGTKWVKIANTDTADITNDAWVNNTTTNVVELATKADGTTARTATEQVVITDTGNVGIGTTTPTPTAKLNVKGNTLLNGYTSIIRDDADVYSGMLDIRRKTTPSGSTAEHPYINFAHQIAGESYVRGTGSIKSGQSNSKGVITIQSYISNQYAPGFAFSQDFINSYTLINPYGGNVGINTFTPQAKLDIKDNDGTSLIIRNATKAHTDASLRNYIDFRDKDDVGYGFVGESSGDRSFGLATHYGYDINIATYTSNTSASVAARLFMSGTTGYVGIGTNTPTQKLDVLGNVRAISFISATTTYPDYVFEKYYKGFSELNKDYTFKALPEVEAFIKANGHLPGYKPAKEIIEAGSFNVTESHLMNVEKIEELYLHTIEQDKKLKAQSEKLKVQSERIEKLEVLVTKLMEAKK